MSGTIKAPVWFWVITIIFLLWSLMGCSMYLVEHLMSDASYGESFGQELLDVRGLMPWWAISGYAFGVWGGLVGGILLMLRKKAALSFFYVSLAGAIVGFIPSIFDDRFRSLMGISDWMFMIFIWAVCIAIILFSRRMRTRGILS